MGFVRRTLIKAARVRIIRRLSQNKAALVGIGSAVAFLAVACSGAAPASNAGANAGASQPVDNRSPDAAPDVQLTLFRNADHEAGDTSGKDRVGTVGHRSLRGALERADQVKRRRVSRAAPFRVLIRKWRGLYRGCDADCVSRRRALASFSRCLRRASSRSLPRSITSAWSRASKMKSGRASSASSRWMWIR